MQCNPVQCSTVQCSAVQCNAMQLSIMEHNMVFCDVMYCSAVQYNVNSTSTHAAARCCPNYQQSTPEIITKPEGQFIVAGKAQQLGNHISAIGITSEGWRAPVVLNRVRMPNTLPIW